MTEPNRDTEMGFIVEFDIKGTQFFPSPNLVPPIKGVREERYHSRVL